MNAIDLGTGLASAVLELPRALFYHTLSQQSGFQIGDDGDLMALLTQLAQVKAKYDKVIVVPSIDSLVLEEPEIVKQGGRYGVRLKASAPSIHMIRADIETEVSPIVGSEKQSEEMIHYLLQEFEGDTAKIWQSNIFVFSLSMRDWTGMGRPASARPGHIFRWFRRYPSGCIGTRQRLQVRTCGGPNVYGFPSA